MEETDLEKSQRICKEVGYRMGIYPMSQDISPSPSVQLVARHVAYASYHASIVDIVDVSHPLSREFHEHCEWLRNAAAQSLSLPQEIGWDEIRRLVGLLHKDKYESEERFWEAYHFGEMTRIMHPDANRILKELSEIKFRSWNL